MMSSIPLVLSQSLLLQEFPDVVGAFTLRMSWSYWGFYLERSLTCFGTLFTFELQASTNLHLLGLNIGACLTPFKVVTLSFPDNFQGSFNELLRCLLGLFHWVFPMPFVAFYNFRNQSLAKYGTLTWNSDILWLWKFLEEVNAFLQEGKQSLALHT